MIFFLLMKSEGLNPWMDKPPHPYEHEGIPPGFWWEQVIKEKIENANYFLAFLSGKSIEKRGYVQQECRMAVRTMSTIPAGEVFVIPILLEECEPPKRFIESLGWHQLQWYKYYEQGVEPLLIHLKNLSKEKFDKLVYFDQMHERVLDSDSDTHALRKDIEYVARKYGKLRKDCLWVDIHRQLRL